MNEDEKRVAREGFERFLSVWEKLPTLVRASISGGAAEMFLNDSKRHTEQSEARGTRMPRRGRVGFMFAMAASELSGLFEMLTNVADAEADRLGINLDIGNGDVEAALIDTIRKSVEEETDKAVWGEGTQMFKKKRLDE